MSKLTTFNEFKETVNEDTSLNQRYLEQKFKLISDKFSKITNDYTDDNLDRSKKTLNEVIEELKAIHQKM